MEISGPLERLEEQLMKKYDGYSHREEAQALSLSFFSWKQTIESTRVVPACGIELG